MKSKKWMFLASTIVVLVAVITLAPAALAQGPTDGNNPGYSRASIFDSIFGSSYRMGADNASSQMFGLAARRGGLANSPANQVGLPRTAQGPGQGNGPGFVDEDGDGVCDNAGTGRGHGHGNGPGFVDEDGDGVCDHAGTGHSGHRGGGKMGRRAQ